MHAALRAELAAAREALRGADPAVAVHQGRVRLKRIRAIARLCLATRAQLHLVGRLGFRIDDKSLRRAGLDYWQHVQIQQHPTFDDFADSFAGSIFLYEARTGIDYDQSRIDGPTALVFGSETRGLSDSILTRGLPTYRLPIYDDRVR
ncbi:MAG: hypothetical protein EBZ50_01670, partial [Alphaproteobacteria bacterium]|nr:hypothetical protein [Alphaproteobacteria bacterium]